MKKFKSTLLVKYLNLYKENPNSRVFAPLSETYRKLGMLDEAFKILQSGIQKHPDYLLGHLVLAHCYFDKQMFMEAYSVLKHFVKDNTDNLSLQKLFAESCLKTGHLEEALQTLKYLLFLNPRDKDISRKVKALEDDLRVAEPSRPTKKTNLESDTSTDNWVNVSFHDKSENKVENKVSDDIDKWNLEKSNVTKIFNHQNTLETSSIDEVDIKEIPFEKPKEKKNPFINHTLVDLYMAQKHYTKAKELLDKILELNPHDERTLSKLNEINARISMGEEQGHERLLNLVDKTVKNQGSAIDTISEKFNLFLEALRHKATAV